MTVHYRDGRSGAMQNVFIRGSKIKFLIFPEMLSNAPMFKVPLPPLASGLWPQLLLAPGDGLAGGGGGPGRGSRAGPGRGPGPPGGLRARGPPGARRLRAGCRGQAGCAPRRFAFGLWLLFCPRLLSLGGFGGRGGGERGGGGFRGAPRGSYRGE